MNALLIPQEPQSQASLDEQLRELQIAANRLGLYDAADIIERVVSKQPHPFATRIMEFSKELDDIVSAARKLESENTEESRMALHSAKLKALQSFNNVLTLLQQKSK